MQPGRSSGRRSVALLTIATGEEWLIVAAQGIAAFGLFALFARRCFWLVVLLTPTALLALSAVDHQGVEIAVQRVGWTAARDALGLAIAELFWRLAPHLPSTASA